MKKESKLINPIIFDIKDDDPYANVFDTKGSTILAMRTVEWNDSGRDNLELRKWIVKGEGETDTPNKGFSFLTEDGPHNLAEMLVREGYGDTESLRDYIDARDESDIETGLTGPDMMELIRS